MNMEIVILGEYNASRPTRSMIGPALEHSAAALGTTVSYDWKRSEDIDLESLRHIQGVFIAPGSPAEESEKIIQAIKRSREEGIPCLGTCGGFQRIIAEYVLNELCYEKIEHQESTPNSSDPLFSELSCSLAGNESEVFISSDTLAASIYREASVQESFVCHYGLSQNHRAKVESKELKISATDNYGEPRIIEHMNHPFFIGTLFVPQVRSTRERPHPLITAFIRTIKTNETLETKRRRS